MNQEDIEMRDKCLAIVIAVRDLCADDGGIRFSPDWGGNSVTVEIAGRGQGHTHVGDPDFTDKQFVDSLYDLLVKGRGLSIVPNETKKQ
jgi:hypothetical protein